MQRSILVLLPLYICALSIPSFAEKSAIDQTIQSIRDLGKGDEKSLSALAQYLHDPERDVRAEAVKSVIRIGGMRSVDPLLTAMRDNDSDIQFRAIDGVVNAYVPGYLTHNSVAGHLTKGVRQVKALFSERNDAAVDPDVKVRPDVAAALAEKITGGNGVDVRSNAALAAGVLRAAESLPALERGLRSKDSDMIFECLVAIEKIKDPTAGPSVSFLARDLDERIQITALEALGILRSLTSADDVRYAYKAGRNIRVQRQALETLAMLGLAGDRPLFLQNLEAGDADLRVAALEGLGRVREPADYPTLQEAFNEANADWRVHSAAAFAMVMQGDNSIEDVAPLQLLTEGFSLKSRANVSAAYLSEVAQKTETRTALARILPEALKERKIGILNALSAAGSPDSLEIIQRYIKDGDNDVAFAAMRALRIAQHG